MKTLSNAFRLSVVAAALAVPLLWTPGTVYAQTTAGHDHDHGAQGGTAPAAPATSHDMKAMHEKMAKMKAGEKAADARLDALVKAMDTATGTAKVDAMAKVLHEMIGDRAAMKQQMADCEAMMMGEGHDHAAKQ